VFFWCFVTRGGESCLDFFQLEVGELKKRERVRLYP
jgi:hypothetical protein